MHTHPFGFDTPWHVGTGLSLIKEVRSLLRAPAPDETGRSPSGIRPGLLVLTGFRLPLGRVQPYVEAQMVNPFGSARGSYLHTGIAIVMR